MEQIWEIGSEIGKTGSATHEHGRELDWFMVSKAIRGNWTIRKENEQPLQGHSPIFLTIPGFRDMDLGERIVNPPKMDLTGKENNAENENPEGYHVDEGIWET